MSSASPGSEWGELRAPFVGSLLIAFLLFIIVGGDASVAIRETYAELAPFWAGTSRFFLAALVMWSSVSFKRIPLPRGSALLGTLLSGTLTVGLAFTLISGGLVETPASRFQILMATVPLPTIFLSYFHGVEAINRRGILGSLLAVGGSAFTVGGLKPRICHCHTSPRFFWQMPLWPKAAS